MNKKLNNLEYLFTIRMNVAHLQNCISDKEVGVIMQPEEESEEH
jgi:hypothetical protein